MKRIIVILLLCGMLTACLPTPEQDAVKQKNTNVLIDTVRAEEQQVQQAATTLPPASEQVPDRFECDFTTALQNVHVISDVPIAVLTDGVFPVVRVEHRALSDAERLTLASRALGTDELFIWQDHLTRKDLERMIRDLMQEPTPEEKAEWMRDMNADEMEYAEMLERRKETLAEYQKQYNELPADDSRIPLFRWDGSVPAYSRDEETPKHYDIVRDRLPEGYLAYQDQVRVNADEMDRPMRFMLALQRDNDADMTLATFFSGAHKAGTVHIDPSDYDRPHADASVTPNDATRTVVKLFSGIADLAPVDVYWANNAATDGDTKGMFTRWGYFIVFTQRYEGAYTPYCSASVHDHKQDYVRSWAYESVAAVVDGEGNLLSFDWRAPYKVTETIAASTTLLPFEEIQSIFETQMNRVYIHDDRLDGTLTVEGATLGLFRIREKDDLDHGLLVPAWFFTGTFAYTEAERDARLSRGYNATQAAYEYKDSLNPLLVINAIDGTIIDPVKGY